MPANTPAAAPAAPNLDEKKNNAYRVGVSILILLALMTVGEFFLGFVAYEWWAPLLAIAMLKSFFVIRDYMHIGRVFAGDEESHS